MTDVLDITEQLQSMINETTDVRVIVTGMKAAEEIKLLQLEVEKYKAISSKAIREQIDVRLDERERCAKTDDSLIEAMARAIVPNHVDEKRWLAAAKAALAVCRPIIEAQTREKCALIAEGMADYCEEEKTSEGYAGYVVANEIAAAIRENGNG